MVSLFTKIRNIKMPVFQIIFYSSVGYLGYCFYQDYRYKQLLSEIQSQSGSNKNATPPIKRISEVVRKISQSKGKRQLRNSLKNMQILVQRYFIDPIKVQNLLDFQMKKLQKSEEQKKIWWLSSYLTLSKLQTSYFFRSDIKKQGTFGIAFWINEIVEQKNQVLQCKNIASLISKALQLRQTKCAQFCNDKNSDEIESKDKQMHLCLKQTLENSASLLKQKERIKMIQFYQNLN